MRGVQNLIGATQLFTSRVAVCPFLVCHTVGMSHCWFVTLLVCHTVGMSHSC
jgi:hypothetical protein